MDGNEKFSWRKRARSFRYAFNGLRLLFSSEHNVRIHTVLALAAIIGGFIFQISLTEWLIIIILIGAVLALEAVNSAIEALADRVSPEQHPLIGKAKDLSAAAVLLMAAAALLSALLIFLPRLLPLLS